ncbi:MAG: hypothetical protein QW076_02925 [Candidatus Anstonellales archaeon]
MIKIPINILLSFIIFIVIAFILILIIGSPNCDSAAKKTAYDLKTKIDEVVSYYPYYSGNDIPNDPDYYAEVQIKLCQERGTSFLEGFLGSEPQYKIYFERFPESGGGIWSEAYPWSGGAASSLRMWAYMRIGTGIFYLTDAALMEKVAKYANAKKWLGQLAHKIRLKVFGPHSQEKFQLVSEIIEDETNGAVKIGEDSSGVYLVRQYKGGEYLYTIDEALDEGWIKGVERNGRIVISNQELDVIIPTAFDADGDPIEHVTVYEKVSPDGKVLDMTTESASVFDENGNFKSDSEGTWRNLKINPSEVYNDWLDTLSPAERALAEQTYITEQEVPFGEWVKYKITDSKFYQRFFKPIEDKIDDFLFRIEKLGYRIQRAVLGSNSIAGIKLAILDAFSDTTILPNGMTKGEVLSEMFLEQDGVKDKIRLILGLSDEIEIEQKHLIDAIKKVGANGLGFVSQEMEWGLHQQAINSIIVASRDGLSLTPESIFRESFGYDIATQSIIPGLEEKYETIKEFAKINGITENEARVKALNFITNDIFPNYLGDLNKGKDAISLTRDSFSHYLIGDFGSTSPNSLVSRFASSDPLVSEDAARQVGLLLGWFENNKYTLPLTKVGILGRTVNAEVKKLIYLDGPQNLLNPTSFYAQALLATSVAAGCEGNSICLVTKNNLETPIYLNEEDDDFDVRIWRPIPIWQWIGIQAALMRVPSHPRFYVVSPCFAMAKIWKTNYDNKPTIFINIEKADVDGEASNYCIADNNLINLYYTIWTTSDIVTLTSWLWSGPLKSMSELLNKIIKVTDPVTLAQGIAEGLISWPTSPWQPLTYEIMQKYQKNLILTKVQK